MQFRIASVEEGEHVVDVGRVHDHEVQLKVELAADKLKGKENGMKTRKVSSMDG